MEAGRIRRGTLVLALALVTLSWGACSHGVGATCEEGSDCGAGLYCELASPTDSTGTCAELPASCSESGACDCEELLDSCANGFTCIEIGGDATFGCL